VRLFSRALKGRQRRHGATQQSPHGGPRLFATGTPVFWGCCFFIFFKWSKKETGAPKRLPSAWRHIHKILQKRKIRRFSSLTPAPAHTSSRFTTRFQHIKNHAVSSAFPQPRTAPRASARAPAHGTRATVRASAFRVVELQSYTAMRSFAFRWKN